MRVTTFVRAERAVYVLVDRKPVSEHSSREEAKREAARLAAWVDGPDSEAARAGRGEGSYGLPRLGVYVLDEAYKALQWHAGGMRVARQPRLSRSAAMDIADMAWRMGVGEGPNQ